MSAEYDLKHNTKTMSLIGAVTAAADTTAVAVDTLGYKSALIQVNVGIGGITFSTTNRVDFVLTHSDDNSTYVAVTDDDVLMPYGATVLALSAAAAANSGPSAGVIKSLFAAHAAVDTTVTGIGYIGKKRYLKLQADFSGTHGTGTPISATALLGNPISRPADEQTIPGGSSYYEQDLGHAAPVSN